MTLATHWPHPHDHFFRVWYGVPNVLASFLRAVLPAAMTQYYKWETLRFEDSLLPMRTGSRRADTVVSIKPKLGSDLSYFLLEHKSYNDVAMPWQLSRYMCLIVEAHRKNHPGQTKYPTVIPLVCYHGSQQLSVSSVIDLFGDPTGEMRRSITKEIRVLDFNQISSNSR